MNNTRYSSLKTAARAILCMAKGRLPGQLVIQITDRCNAICPQCGMRKTNGFARTRLATDRIKSMIDAAGEKGIQALSFTGGEPMLLQKDLPELITHAGKAGIPYIRTGTNGFFFMNHDRPDFEDRIKAIADNLAATPLRNFWISLDSSQPHVHEAMRGFDGVVRGMEKALPLFHDRGIFPSVNLGLNRNLTRETVNLQKPGATDLKFPQASAFYQTFVRGFEAFYQKVIDLGFTIANACYPMSMADDENKKKLDAVYAAASPDRVVCFDPVEKALLFKALMDTIPRFRSKIRIFSPLTSLVVLYREYASLARPCQARPFPGYPCRGGIDFFYVNCHDGNTYPCGYRGNQNLGAFEDLDIRALDPNPFCRACDWECFRDPSELAGPLTDLWNRPLGLAREMIQTPSYLRLWLKDLTYYRACSYFDGRTPPRYIDLNRF